MLARLYIAGTGVGFNVPVMIRHALFSSKSILQAWFDLARTGA